VLPTPKSHGQLHTDWYGPVNGVPSRSWRSLISWTSVSPGSYPHEWFDICASADRHATRYPETRPVAANASAECPNGSPSSLSRWTVALVIKPDQVNLHLAASIVSQYEELRDSADLCETVGRQNFPHPWLMGVPHDEIQVLVFTGLLANQGVDTPAAIQPHIRARGAEPP
jgi:hypothetical protein